ncbi:metalloprotease [Gordonia phage LuckyLeo]|nr:metalloprotease [Gordonia phage LuckyLeo]
MEYMPADLAHTLAAMARSTHNEICGFILDDWTLITVQNIAKIPSANFEMDMSAILEAINLAAKSARDIIGIYHSHPGGMTEPSETDLQGWPRFLDGRYSRYWLVTGETVREFERFGEGAEIGFQLVHSVGIGIPQGPKKGLDQSVPKDRP